MASLLKAYNTALIRRPYATGSASAAFLFGAGDVLAQQAVEKKGREHDLWRTGRIAFYGGAIFSPIITRWYVMLEGIKVKSKPALLLTRVGLDQFVLTPAMVGLFFTSLSVMEGKGIEGARDRISKAWWSTLKMNWGVFIPVQLLNFALVPPHLRILLVNGVSLFWNTYLSYVNSKAEPVKDKVKELIE